MAKEVFDIGDADFDEDITNGKSGTDTAFRKITRNSTTFLIWRLDNMMLTALPKEQYGVFFNKDTYIIFAATQNGQPSGVNIVNREVRGRLEYHIHYWLGAYANVDKSSLTAYKVVELDNFIGGQASQHRESQGRESPRFRSYFTNGIRILSGTESSWRENESHLYRIKGSRVPILTQMLDISWSHFCSSDIFVLDTKHVLFVWTGRAATAIEKLHGITAALQLQSEKGTDSIIFVDDGYEKTLLEEDRKLFESYLPLHERTVKSSDEILEEYDRENRIKRIIKLYHCCVNQGKYRITEIKGGPLRQEDLNHETVMILDHGLSGIWIWVGSDVNNKERIEAIRNARGFVKKKKYPNRILVSRVLDGIEPFEFKVLFSEWKEKDDIKGNAAMKNKIPVIKVTRFDALTMHDRPALAAKSQLIDDASGTLKMWRIKLLEAFELPKERFGVFFTGDCYTILYTYKTVGGVRHIIYQWMGYHSTADDQGVAALKAIELDCSRAEGKAMQVRLCQGKEPVHFLQLFKGHMRIFNGRGTDFDVSGKNLKSPNHYLLLIQGSTTYNTRATQVVLKATSLNSNYCFVLRKGNTYYIWCGSSSTGDNREMAKGFVGVDFMLLLEGSETADFWAALCGKLDYVSKKLPEFTESQLPPRLFQCGTASENFRAVEILHFTQQDLIPEEVMLLDAYHSVYLWIGSYSSSEEHRLSLDIAIEYLITDPQGRDMKTPIIQLRQGYEPPTFIGFFGKWDDKLWIDHKSHEKLRREIESSNSRFLPRDSNSSDNEFDSYNKYSLAVLKGPVENLPAAVDPLKKELHLTYDDFVTMFNMEYREFEKLPLWKRQEMKKVAGLF